MQERIGHYEIVSELGRGGMGVVYKAHEESLNRFVAIKVLGSHLAEDPSYVERFVREARAAAKLSHPNIVQIFAIDRQQDTHYFVMEYVSGTSLQAKIRSRGSLPVAEALRLMMQTAAGLQAAHEQGVVHRDVKPANLLISDRGLLKIADFGLAIFGGATARLTATGMMMGTPGYLSPEQCRDDQIDHRTDIYSLGVTLFEALTGSMPFTADSPLALIRQIVDVEPPDVRELNPEVGEDVRDILRGMMAKDREQRTASCQTLMAEFQAALERRGESLADQQGVAAGTAPQAPFADTRDALRLNVEQTVVVQEDTAANAPVSTNEVPVETAPATAQAAPPPPRRRGRLALVVAALLLLGAGTLLAGAIVVWKTGLLDRVRRVASGDGLQTTEVPELMDPAPTEAIPVAQRADERPTGEAADGQPPESAGGQGENHIAEQVEAQQLSPPRSPAVSGGESGPEVGRPAAADTRQAPQQQQPLADSFPMTPPANTIVVIGVGETLLAGEAEAFVERALTRTGAVIVDEDEIPAMEGLSVEQPPPRRFLHDTLRPHARSLVVVKAEYLGDRPLRYMGYGDAAFQARLTAAAVDLDLGRPVTAPFERRVEYTHLTVERVVTESMQGWVRRLSYSVTDRRR